MNTREKYKDDGPFCPKCGANSGDSWPCDDGCPINFSPHYDPAIEHVFQDDMELFYWMLKNGR